MKTNWLIPGILASLLVFAVAGCNRPHVNKIRRKRAAQLPFRRANKSKASNPDALNLNYSFFLGKLSHRKPHECMNTLLPAASKETP